MPNFASRIGAGAVFCDFDPLRAKTAWKNRVAESLACPLLEVDAHNIVPAGPPRRKRSTGPTRCGRNWRGSSPHFLAEFPPLEKHPFPWEGNVPPIDLEGTLLRAAPSAAVPEVQSPAPGPSAGKRALAEFAAHRLENYGTSRNDPNRDGCSGLSPYLHYGQLSPQRVALEVSRAPVDAERRKAFLEELVVRRELSDNLCLYNPAYDSPEGFPAWAPGNLSTRLKPSRTRPPRTLSGTPPRPGWPGPAASTATSGCTGASGPGLEPIRGGSPGSRHALDGRDPNGYAGAAWCIGGVHDRPWPERPVFGKIRTMTASGCRRKFDVEAYVRESPSL